MKLRVAAATIGVLLLVAGISLIYWKAGLIAGGIALIAVGLFTEVTDATY